LPGGRCPDRGGMSGRMAMVRRGDFVELDGLLAVVVAIEGDDVEMAEGSE
jgi:hypothetical protein